MAARSAGQKFINVCMLLGVASALGSTEIPTIHLTKSQEQRNASRASSVPINTAFSLSSKQLNKQGYQSTMTVFNSVDGLMVRRSGSSNHSATISMRGFGDDAAQNSLVLLNGLPMVNPDLEGFSWGQIPLSMIRKIQVVPDSESVLYGSGAVGGIVNIITQNSDAPANKLQTAVGTYGQRHINWLYARRLPAHWFMQVDVDHAHANGYRAHSAGGMNNLSLQLTQVSHGWHTWFSYLYLDAKQDFPDALTAPAAFDNPQQATSSSDFDQEQQHWWQLQVRHALSSTTKLTIAMAANIMHGHGRLGENYNDERNEFMLRPSLYSAFNIKQHAIFARYGVALATSRYQTNYPDPSFDYHAHVRQTRMAIYDLNTIPLALQWQWTFGLRLAKANTQLNNISFGAPLVAHDANTASVFSTNISWHLARDWRAELQLAQNYRFPRTGEQASTQNNQPLKTQTGVSYDLQLHWQRAKQQASVHVYQLDINHEINYIPYRLQANINLPPTRRLGLIVASRTGFAKHWQLRANYNFVHAYFRQGQFSGRAIPLVPQQWMHIGLEDVIQRHWTASADLFAFASDYAGSDFQNALPQVAGYATVNTSLGYHRQRYNVHILLSNLLDKHYFGYVDAIGNTKYYYPANGRSVILSCSINL